ncbi:MAG: hypothetical protein ABUL64_00975 [Singulisphaera sp.]
MPDVLVYGAAIFLAAGTSALFVALISCFGSGSGDAAQRNRSVSYELSERGTHTSDSGSDESDLVPLRSQGLGIGVVLVGGLAGHAALGLWPRWPPAGALDRFLILGLAAAVCLELAVTRLKNRPGLRIALEVVGALLLCEWLLHRSVYLQNSLSEQAILLGTSAVVLVLVHETSIRLAARAEPGSLPLAIAATLAASGALIMMAGYLKGGAAALPWAAAIVGTVLGVSVTRSRIDLQGVAGLGIFILFSLLFIGLYFGRLTMVLTLVLMFAPLSGWIIEHRAFASWSGWRKELLRFSLVVATLLAILTIGKGKFDREMRPLLGVRHTSSVGPRQSACDTTIESHCSRSLSVPGG